MRSAGKERGDTATAHDFVTLMHGLFLMPLLLVIMLRHA